MDDDGGQPGAGNVEKDRGQGVQRKEDNDGGEDTSKWRSDTGLRLDGSPRERSGGRVPSEERTKDVGEADGNKLLRRVDDVVVHSAERLRDGNVLNDQDNDGQGKISCNCAENLLVHAWCANVLEACRKKSALAEDEEVRFTYHWERFLES